MFEKPNCESNVTELEVIIKKIKVLNEVVSSMLEESEYNIINKKGINFITPESNIKDIMDHSFTDLNTVENSIIAEKTILELDRFFTVIPRLKERFDLIKGIYTTSFLQNPNSDNTEEIEQDDMNATELEELLNSYESNYKCDCNDGECDCNNFNPTNEISIPEVLKGLSPEEIEEKKYSSTYKG